MDNAAILVKTVLVDILLVLAALGGVCYTCVFLLVHLRILQGRTHLFVKYLVIAGVSVMLSGVSLSLVMLLLYSDIELLCAGLFLSFVVTLILAGSLSGPGFWISVWSRLASRKE